MLREKKVQRGSTKSEFAARITQIGEAAISAVAEQGLFAHTKDSGRLRGGQRLTWDYWSTIWVERGDSAPSTLVGAAIGRPHLRALPGIAP